jgi:3D (Asp-Asp-Asp) domain-containing protein
MGDEDENQKQKQNIDWATDIHLVSYVIKDTTLAVVHVPPHEQQQKIVQTIRIPITAYSSTPDQTDGNPYITASGARVRDGIVAANFLPIGTLVRIPDLYGDKIFVVKDRMNSRYWKRMDIWMSTRQEALNFGLRYAYVEILN